MDVRKSTSDRKGKYMKHCPKCKASYSTGQRFCSNDGATLTLQDPYNLVGRALVDKYRLDALVGIGGMGAVYCASHLSTGRQVAVKILLPNLAIGNPRLLDLFEREARVVGRLRHENIVDIIDAGLTTDGIAYIAMEWLEGRTLDEEIQRNGPLGLQRVSEIIRQVAAALQESHSQHIIHRDLKPSNIFMVKRATGREQVKVVDFGISKSIGDTGGSPVSSVMGTPQYASPEQFRLGDNIDSRTDIYSLGVVLFQMLTNALPFNDTTISALIHKHLNEPPPPLRGLRPDIPPALEDLVNRMLAKQPADRPQRVGDIPDLFDRAITANLVTVADEAPISETPSELQQPQAQPPTQPPTQPPIQPPPQFPMQTPTPPTAPFPSQPTIQPPAHTPAQFQAPPTAQYPMQTPTQPPMQYPMQPPMQPPMQYPMQPPMQPPAQYQMQPPMQPPAQYQMQPPMQYSAPPTPSKRRWGTWTFVIGGSAALFAILVIGVAIVLYMNGSSSVWKENMEAERKAFREGRYLEAVNLAQAELKEAETFGPQDSRLATSLHNAGELYTRLERYDEAEKFLQRALSIRKKEDAEAARTICALARLEQSRGNRDQAERRYRQSLAIREKILGKDHPDVAESLNGLAGVLALKQIGNAEEMARRSLSIREKALGENHQDVAESISTLVEVTIDIGKPKEIESYLRRAITIRETTLGESHPDLAQSLIDMGVFLDKRAQCRDAETPIRRAIPILEKTYGTNHPVVARSYLALASVLAGQNKVSEFEDFCDRAVAILEKSSGRESRDVAKALSVKGTALMNLGNYKDAETNLLQSLAILEKSERLMGELVAEADLNLATLYSKQAAYTKAEEYLQRSTTAYENALGKDNPVLSALLIIQAMNLGRLKRTDEADAKLRQADAGIRRATGTIRAPLASLSAVAGALLLFEKGDYNQASQKIGNLGSTLEDSPLLFGDVVHLVYLVSVAQQAKPIIEGMAKVFLQARSAGQVPDAQTDNTVQRIEILESTAKRGLALVEREQCKRNQNLLGEYKTLLAGLYTIKALCFDTAGRHQDAMTVLRDNITTIQESLKQGGPKSDLYNIFTLYANLLTQTGRNDDAQEIESFVKEIPVGNVSKN
jgi:serine/threonine protein kinase/tetratricopeptide (TPR) repeat protein